MKKFPKINAQAQSNNSQESTRWFYLGNLRLLRSEKRLLLDGNQKSEKKLTSWGNGSFFFPMILQGFIRPKWCRISSINSTNPSTTNKSQPHDVQTPTAQLVQKNRTLLGVTNTSSRKWHLLRVMREKSLRIYEVDSRCIRQNMT